MKPEARPCCFHAHACTYCMQLNQETALNTERDYKMSVLRLPFSVIKEHKLHLKQTIPVQTACYASLTEIRDTEIKVCENVI